MDVVYRNTYYSVLVNKKANKYIVLNRLTHIVEDEVTKLPTAIGMAKASESALLKLIKEEEHDSPKENPY